MHKSVQLVFVYMLFEALADCIKLHPPPYSPLNAPWQSYHM